MATTTYPQPWQQPLIQRKNKAISKTEEYLTKDIVFTYLEIFVLGVFVFLETNTKNIFRCDIFLSVDWLL